MTTTPPPPPETQQPPAFETSPQKQKSFADKVRLRALGIGKGDAQDGRRSPFFGSRRFPEETRFALETSTTAALRAVALGLSPPDEQQSGVLPPSPAASSEKNEVAFAALATLRESEDESLTKYAAALDELLETRQVPFPEKGPFAEALTRLRAEVDAATEDVDFCLSLADRVQTAEGGVFFPALPTNTSTGTANALSNRLLRAACYGDRDDVAVVRGELEAALATNLLGREASAYVEALATLATSKEKTAVADSAFATFFLERRAETPLAARLGDAYVVALQRFLGELTRRGAIAGAGFSKVVSDQTSPPSSLPSLLLGTTASTSSGRGSLRFNFIEWEMRLRRDLVTSRAKDSERALHPKDFAGTWQIVFVSETPDDSLPLDSAVASEDGVAIEVAFLPDGRVLPTAKNKPTTWRVRPGPAHLDTCEFSVDLADRSVSFCGYVDRGQRIESRFSKRPIKVSGFAYEQKDQQAAEDEAEETSSLSQNKILQAVLDSFKFSSFPVSAAAAVSSSSSSSSSSSEDDDRENDVASDADEDSSEDDPFDRTPSGRFAMLGPVGNDRTIAPF